MDSETAAQGYFMDCMDPGGETGMSLLHIRPREFELIDWATVPYDPRLGSLGAMPSMQLIEWNARYPGRHHLLYENFHLRNNDAQKDVTALRVIGSVEQVMFERDLFEAVHPQEPVEAKHMVPDEVLEALGLHMGHEHAQRHVRDSLRHAVAHLTRMRYLPVCRVAYPRGGRTTTPPVPRSRRSGGSTRATSAP
jgi:hypothetical protein